MLVACAAYRKRPRMSWYVTGKEVVTGVLQGQLSVCLAAFRCARKHRAGVVSDSWVFFVA